MKTKFHVYGCKCMVRIVAQLRLSFILDVVNKLNGKTKWSLKNEKKIRFVIVNLTMKCWNEAYKDEISLIVVFFFVLFRFMFSFPLFHIFFLINSESYFVQSNYLARCSQNVKKLLHLVCLLQIISEYITYISEQILY